MYLAQTADHPWLEQASWIVAICALALVVLQLILYWFGRWVPLKVRATGQKTKDANSAAIVRVEVEFRSRTRETQTVREVLLFKAPNAVSRALRPWWFNAPLEAEPFTTLVPVLPLAIDGHDAVDIVASRAGEQLPYGHRCRVKVRASRRRPQVAKVRMKT